MTTSTPPLTRTSLRRVLQRGVAPIAIGIVVGALLALVVTALLPKRYTATSRVLVTATGVDSTAQANSRTTGLTNLDTEAQLVTSAAVVQGATQTYTALTRLTFETVVGDIAVAVPPNSSVLEISFTADSAEMARSAANALAASYLNDRQTNAQKLLDRQRSQAGQTVQSLTSSLEKLSAQLAALPRSSTDRGLLNTRIGILKTQINGENSQIVTLGSVQITPGRVVTAASLPDHPSSPARTVNTLSGAALGLVLGLLAAWLLLSYTRTVRRADDVSRVVDVPCLGVLGGGRAAVAEQYRHLALLAANSVHRPRRLVFAGPLDSPAVSQVATGVAEALVRGGRTIAMLRVNAQDVNGRRPRGVPLESRPDTDTIAPGEPLDAGLERVRDQHDLLVIAVGGASSTVDAAALGATADAVVLVVESGTRARFVATAVRALDEVGAPMLGVVLTRGSVDAPVSALHLPAHVSAPAEPDATPRKITLEPPLLVADILPAIDAAPSGDDDTDEAPAETADASGDTDETTETTETTKTTKTTETTKTDEAPGDTDEAPGDTDETPVETEQTADETEQTAEEPNAATTDDAAGAVDDGDPAASDDAADKDTDESLAGTAAAADEDTSDVAAEQDGNDERHGSGGRDPASSGAPGSVSSRNRARHAANKGGGAGRAPGAAGRPRQTSGRRPV